MSSIASFPSVIAPMRAPAASPSLEPLERPTGPPVFTRDAKAAANVKDKGVLRQELHLAEYLRGMGLEVLQSWANIPVTGYDVNAHALAGQEFAHQMPNQQNRMRIYAVGNGLEIGPTPMAGDDHFERPHLRVQPAAGGMGVGFTLNGRELNLMQASSGDLELAAKLVELIYR